MSRRVAEQLRQLQAEQARSEEPPALVAAVASGCAPLGVLAELAAQQQRIIASDRRSLLLLATRCADLPVGAWFADLAEGEGPALRILPALAAACGLDPEHAAARPPLPGCQAYPAYLAWLALNGRPAAVAGALVANFTAWGGYCAAIGAGLRRHYGFADEDCAFFDFFARPAIALEQQAAEALGPNRGDAGDTGDTGDAGLDGGTLTAAREYSTLLQAYERLFWETLDALPVARPS
ncbi:transcriptional regulator [Kitasatospora sp. NBC_01560]|uniref:transcriptional regulator n=1 Tax=Kitasatospora sp. NBC_01560 TaxID=2975965 RepID=UPI003870D0D2